MTTPQPPLADNTDAIPDDPPGETRARETALREILHVISASRGDELPVFEAILKNAARLCHAPLAFLTTANEANTHVTVPAVHGVRPEFAEVLKRFNEPMEGTDLVAVRAIAQANVIRSSDIGSDTDLPSQSDWRRELVETEGVRSILVVPLLQGGGAIGAIILYRRKVDPFSDADVALVETFAEQAVIAIENVRQFREVQTRLQREEASREILGVISRSRDDELPVFAMIVEKAARLCGSPMASLMIVDQARTHLVIASHWGVPLVSFRPGVTRIPLDGEIAAARAIREKRAIHVEDLADDEVYRRGDPMRVKAVDDEGIRTYLAVPMISGDRAIGNIALYRREVNPFNSDEIAMVETFAKQAVIAIENVRQFRELQTRLEREEASREILQVISASRADTAPVFEVILQNAARLCGAPMASMAICNDERTHLVMQAHWGDTLTHLVVDQTTWPLDGPTANAVAVREQIIVQIENLKDTDAYRGGDPGRVEAVDKEGIRTFLAVPLIAGGLAIGCIALYRREVQPFDDSQIELVQTFAAQAVIAIENVRQFRELQARLEREAALREILEVISRSRSDELPVLETIVRNAARLCDATLAGVSLVNDMRTHLRYACIWGEDNGVFRTGHEFEFGGPLQVPTTVREARTIHTHDLSDDPLYVARDPTRVKIVEEVGVRTFLTVPLVRDGVAFGCLNLNRFEVRPFDEADIALVETFAEQALIAIENVRQFKALETLNAELGDRVDEQVGELERMGRLKRFLSPQVADAVVSSGDDNLLGSHRAMIAILFCDIRGFTAFCESAEPEETIEVLQTFHETLGRLIHAAGAGFDHRAGDGIMVVFNDPVPCDDPVAAALHVAVQMRECMVELCGKWRKLGHRMGFGVGISLGYATVGMVGFEGRFDYTASGTAVNLAARLCDHAADQEILLSQRAATALEDIAEVESAGELTLKGFHAPVDVFRVKEMKDTQ